MKSLNTALDGFFENPNLSVGVIKGEWGVGKSYYWRNYIQNSLIADSKAVFYVSLFGMRTSRDLKRKLIAGFSPARNQDRHKDIRSRAASRLSKISSVFKPLEGLKMKGLSLGDLTGLALPFVENELLSNSIVCFDDLERSDGLSMKEFLGLVTELTEERGCKVVLIYNEKELTPKDDATLAVYREKVVDIEWNFAPEIQDNLHKVWKGTTPEEITAAFTASKKNNIRVMKKTKYVIEYFHGFLTGVDLAVVRLINERVALVCNAYYNFPQLRKFLKNRGTENYFQTILKDEADESLENKLNELLGWSQPELDTIIHDYLEQGHLDQDKTHQFFDAKGQEIQRIKLGDEYSRIWRGLHGGFGITQDDFINNLTSFVLQHHEHLQIRNIDESDRFIKKLGGEIPGIERIREQKIEHYISSCEDPERAAWSIDMHGLSPEMMEEIRGKLLSLPTKMTLDELFTSLVDPSGCSPSKCRYFEAFTDDELRHFLEGPLVTVSDLHTFFERFSDRGDGGKEIGNRIRAMLDVYRHQSDFNALKVERILKGANAD